MILGSGPNRIGQGLEFDYCCCHAAFALRDEGLETIMINCNPETVSTDYDTVDRLYFEPLTFEDVSAIVAREEQRGGEVACVVQYGGQTPLKLALSLQEAGIKILGTSPDSIDLAEDRERFAQLLWDLGIPQAPSGIATGVAEAREVAGKIGFPLVVRPSYVLGGRAMAIVYDTATLDRYMTTAVAASPGHPILIDKFLEDAFELDVDAVADETGAVVIGGIMEHIEEAGIHSGDSSCVVPPYLVSPHHVAQIRDYTRRVARALKVVGLMNAQFAIKDQTVYVLEVNPRASRTVPYLSKATGVPLAKVAARVMIGRTLAEQNLTEDLEVSGVFVKTPVFPFVRFPGVDTILGPEMKSTGEVMGGAATFGMAFAKAQLAAGNRLPPEGAAFISVNNYDKPAVVPIARDLAAAGFKLDATRGTANFLRAHGLDAEIVFKVNEGRPHVGDEILNNHVQLVINTPLGRESFFDDRTVRRIAMMHGIPCITTLTGAAAAVNAIRAMHTEGLTVRALQEYHAASATKRPERGAVSAQVHGLVARSSRQSKPLGSCMRRASVRAPAASLRCPWSSAVPSAFLAPIAHPAPGLTTAAAALPRARSPPWRRLRPKIRRSRASACLSGPCLRVCRSACPLPPGLRSRRSCNGSRRRDRRSFVGPSRRVDSRRRGGDPGRRCTLAISTQIAVPQRLVAFGYRSREPCASVDGRVARGTAVKVTASLRLPVAHRNPGRSGRAARARPAWHRARGVGQERGARRGRRAGITRGGMGGSVRAWARSATRGQRWRMGRAVGRRGVGHRHWRSDGVSHDDERRLQEAGTYHVIAISGGNIAILTVLLLGGFRLFRVPPRAAAGAAILALLFYGRVTGPVALRRSRDLGGDRVPGRTTARAAGSVDERARGRRHTRRRCVPGRRVSTRASSCRLAQRWGSSSVCRA